MTRKHQRWHLGLWLVIGPLLIAAAVAAIALRPDLPAPSESPDPVIREAAP